MKIILASGSPRRRELLAQAGYEFTVEVSDADENITGLSPDQMVEELSFRKAMAVVNTHLIKKQDPFRGALPDSPSGGDKQKSDKDETLFIGADTVVALEGEILGKPEDETDAARMLAELSGRTHQVYTGVSLILVRGNQIAGRRTFSECTDVAMRDLSGMEIRDYIAGGEPMDKAGAYGIQGKAAVFVSGIQGDYYNVVGLPICRLTVEIGKLS